MPQEFEQFTYSRIPGEKKEGERPHGYAWLFDGHGAQFVGMGRELAQTYWPVRDLYKMGDQVVGYPLSRISFFGPEEAVLQTKFAQPLIVENNEACLRILREEAYEDDPRRFNNPPRLVAGESLGMLNALHVAGAFGEWGSQKAFASLMRFAAYRGSVFQKVAESNPSTLFMVSATKKCDQGDFEEIIEALQRQHGMNPALIKAQNEYIVGGKMRDVESMAEFLSGVSDLVKHQRIPTATGAFHTEEMADAVPYIRDYFDAFPLQDTRVPVLLNTGGNISTTTDARILEQDCINGVTMPVQGPSMVRYVEGQNIAGHYVIGEKGLFARTLRNNSENISIAEKIKSKKGALSAGGAVGAAVAAAGLGMLVYRKEHQGTEELSEDNK